MSRLAIIPARGGSKRIPRKNIKEFLGKPIISYSINAALDCGMFSEIMVSTDDREIAEVAKKFGAKVPFYRSDYTSNDFATTVDVLTEVIEAYQKIGRTFTEVCCIYPTAPLVTCQALQKGYELLKEDGVNSVFPVVAFSYPVQRSVKVAENNTAIMVWPDYYNVRSQDLEDYYHDAGQWYWFKPKLIKDKLYTEASKVLILDETEAQDIDNISDWSLAEMKYKFLYER